MRTRSSSEDRRYRQDIQSLIGLGILALVTLSGLLSTGLKPYCWGALCGALAPMVILMLRYVHRLVSSFKMDVLGIVNAIGYVAATLAICVVIFPFHIWHFFVLLLLFVATVYGLHQFKFTPLFMVLNCLLAGVFLF